MRSIYRKILLLNLTVILLCTLVLGGTSILFLTNEKEQDAEQILNLTAEHLADTLNRNLYSTQSAVDSLSASAQDRLPGLVALQNPSFLPSYVRDMEDSTRMIADHTDNVCTYYMRIAPELTQEETGFVYSKTDKSDKPVKVSLTDLSKFDPEDTEHVGWYYQPKNAGKAVWMEPYYNKNMDIYMISYVVPLYKEGVFLGVLGMDLDFDQINKDIQNYKPYRTSQAFITSDSGKIYYPPENIPMDDISEVAPELARLEQSFNRKSHQDTNAHHITTYEFNGIRRILAHSHTINGMNLMLDVETSEIYKSRNLLVFMILIATVLIGLISILISMRASRRITEPLKQLTIAANKISDGEMNVELPPKTDDEIGILTDSLDKTVASLQTLITGMADKDYIDPITHVRNKTSFEITMESLAQRISKGDRRFGLMMMDVNNLRATNESYGIDVGNEYLLNCCHLICQIYKHSPVYRIGDDEFTVILEGTDLENYRNLNTQMSLQMERSLQNQKPQDRISISKGASFCMPSDIDPEDILQRANKMMRLDKQKPTTLEQNDNGRQ